MPTPGELPPSFAAGRAAGLPRVAGTLLVLIPALWVRGPTVRGMEADGPSGTGTLQEEEKLVLAGRVLVADRPADTGTVVLHRVSGEWSGEVDSVALGEGGFFHLGLPADTDDDVFFATVRYQDILYFGQAVTGLPEPGDSYVIRAYPALPAGPETGPRVRVRNVIATRSDSGEGWAVVDFFELLNGLSATLVPSDVRPSWSHALPHGARDPSVGRSDLSPGMASFRDGRVRVTAPVPPGESVYLLRYTLPTDDFSIPLEVAVGSMELLITEPAGDLAVAGLAAVDGVELEGVRYRRFAGRDMAPSVVTVTAGTTRLPFGSLSLAAVFLTLLLACAGALVAARSRSAVAGPASSRRRRVLLEIARLDEDWAGGRLEAEDYRNRRTRLLGELGG
ncbi:MAG: hypothetical protein OXQ94_16975 [Gemmatimonadota bacterium]|nr:hypothetical protein [Gemmatimonadota bacterium]MDE2873373.1 hypothetical protein [Gemmatimonadota bacterium]